MGRPKGSKNKPKYPEHQKYRPDWVEDYLMEIAGNKTMHEVYESNIDKYPTPATVGKWLVKHKEFYENYLIARRAGAEIDADFIRYIADSCDAETPANVQKARLQVDTRMKIISKLLPGIYGDKVQVEQTIDDRRTLNHSDIKSKVDRVREKYEKKDDLVSVRAVSDKLDEKGVSH